MVPYNALYAIQHSGGILLCAFDGAQQMVGFVFSFMAELEGQRAQWSHMAGVLPAYERQGIGTRLKFAQRQVALKRGMPLIGWTFDPLRRGNAIFNVEILGVRCHAYHPEKYGPMPDAINRGLLSDRFEAHWHLKDTGVITREQGRPAPITWDATEGDYLLYGEHDEPRLGLSQSLTASHYALQIPNQVLAHRQMHPARVHRWYYALREAVAALHIADYQVTRVDYGAIDTFSYILERPAPWFLYLVETSEGTLYTGITTDLNRRIADHNAGRGAKYTASRRPVVLKAAWQTYGQSKATQLENNLKRRSRAQKLALIASDEDFKGAKRLP